MRRAAIVLAIIGVLAGCKSGQHDYPEPPRVDSQPKFVARDSTLTVPIRLSLDDMERALERSTPRRLWGIDEQRANCVPPQRVKVLGRRIRVSPDIGCRIVGQVTRGGIRLTGKGRRLTITMPVTARISAKDVGGVLKGETANGSATVRADVDLGVDGTWNPHAKVAISYGWREPPGIDFLGQRIRFARRADRELAGVIAGLERDLQRQIARARVRPIVAGAWKQGFAVLSLNRENPPVWMRITPKGIGLADFGVRGRTLDLTVAAAARTETFVGPEAPAAPAVTRLPAQMKLPPERGLRFSIPVLADYTELEPVVLRALRKLADKGIRVKGVGRVEAEFEKVTIHATENGRIAVGIEVTAEPVGERFGTRLGRANGKVWITGLPVNEQNSQVVRVRDLEIFGGADRLATDLVIRLIATDKIREQIAAGLVEDFGSDYDRVLASAKAAIAQRREGDFLIAATIDEVSRGQIQVTSKGLFMPVEVLGSASIVHAPGR